MRETVRKVGQRFMVGFEGLEASPEVKRLLRDLGVGNVILFARNVDRPEQVAELVRELQSLARDAGHLLPLLVAVDQEGGRVQRLRGPWTVWPPARAVGRIGSEDVARRVGEAIAAELTPCGIRLNLAPVMDVDTNPRNPVIGDRSFGDEPDLVGRMGVAMIRGLQGAGVAACAKHFPGHGDTGVDSHLDLPVVDHSRTRLEDVELRPFRRAIEEDVAAIMTAHVLFRELDDKVPSTLSRAVVGDLLRGRMRYGGVVVSDDLEMSAVSKRWPPAVAAVLAAKAGCDILPVSAGTDSQVEAIEGMIRAVESADIPWAAADDAEARVRRLKERFLLPYKEPDAKVALQAAGALERVALAEEIAERSGMGA